MHDETFACLVELLDIKQAELDSVFAMKPAKRRKLQVAFNLLARCDDGRYDLAQSVADDLEEEDEEEDESSPVSDNSSSPVSDSQAAQDVQHSCMRGGKKALIVMEQERMRAAAVGMKGAELISSAGRKAPVMA